MLKLEIISISGVIYSGNCVMAVVPAESGEIGVLENHEAFVAKLKKGKVAIFSDGNRLEKEIEIEGGFAQIDDGERLSLLV